MKRIKITEAEKEILKQKFSEELDKLQGIPSKIEIPTGITSTFLKDKEKATVVFCNEAYKQMLALIDNANKEIGWYATVKRDENDNKKFIIEKILMFPQTVTGATVKTDDQKFIEWQDSLSDDDFNHCRFYGHSHVNMGVSPSGVDEKNYSDLLKNINDFYVFGIFNKRKEAFLNVWDIENNVLYENADIEYKYYIADEDNWAKEQIKNFVSEDIPKASNTSFMPDKLPLKGKKKAKYDWRDFDYDYYD